MSTHATIDEFEFLQLRAGTVVRVEDFPEARKPAYKIWVDFGDLGEKKTSARITELYSKEELLGRQIVGVTNLAPRQIGPFVSEFLLTGFYNSEKHVVIAIPERPVPNGAPLS